MPFSDFEKDLSAGPQDMLCPAGECDNVAGELAEAQATSAELSGERDELAGSLANLEADHANLLDAHSSLKCARILEALYQTISNSSFVL